MNQAHSIAGSPDTLRDSARKHGSFLAFASLMTMFSTYGQSIFIGSFGDDFRKLLKIGEDYYGWVYSGATLLSAATMIWVGKRIDTSDFRRYTRSVLLALTVACLLMAGVNSIVMLFIGIFAMRFAGQGLMSHVSITGVGRYFERARGRAMIFVALGFAIGDATLPRLNRWLEAAFPSEGISVLGMAIQPWQAVWVGCAASVLLIVLPIAMRLLRRHAERHQSYEANLEAEERQREERNEGPSRHKTRAEVLRDPVFYLVMPSILAPPFLMTAIFVHQDSIEQGMVWETNWFVTIFIAFAVGRLLASIGSGFMVDRLTATRMLAMVPLPLGVGLLALAASPDPLVATALLFAGGLSAGAQSTVFGAVWAELYGTKHLGAIRAVTLFAVIFSTAASPPLVGELLNAGVGIDQMCLGGTVYIALGAALCGLATRLHKRRVEAG